MKIIIVTIISLTIISCGSIKPTAKTHNNFEGQLSGVWRADSMLRVNTGEMSMAKKGFYSYTFEPNGVLIYSTDSTSSASRWSMHEDLLTMWTYKEPWYYRVISITDSVLTKVCIDGTNNILYMSKIE